MEKRRKERLDEEKKRYQREQLMKMNTDGQGEPEPSENMKKAYGRRRDQFGNIITGHPDDPPCPAVAPPEGWTVQNNNVDGENLIYYKYKNGKKRQYNHPNNCEPIPEQEHEKEPEQGPESRLFQPQDVLSPIPEDDGDEVEDAPAGPPSVELGMQRSAASVMDASPMVSSRIDVNQGLKDDITQVKERLSSLESRVNSLEIDGLTVMGNLIEDVENLIKTAHLGGGLRNTKKRGKTKKRRNTKRKKTKKRKNTKKKHNKKRN